MRWCSGGGGGASDTFACRRPPKKLLLFLWGLPLEIYFTSSYRMKILSQEGKKRILIWMDIFRYSSNVSQQNQINVAKLAYGENVM